MADCSLKKKKIMFFMLEVMLTSTRLKPTFLIEVETSLRGPCAGSGSQLTVEERLDRESPGLSPAGSARTWPQGHGEGPVIQRHRAPCVRLQAGGLVFRKRVSHQLRVREGSTLHSRPPKPTRPETGTEESRGAASQWDWQGTRAAYCSERRVFQTARDLLLYF